MLRRLPPLRPALRHDALVAFLLLCGTLPFALNFGTYFLADDFVLLNWTRVDSPGKVWTFFDPSDFWFYRPLVKAIYWAGQNVWGLNAAPFHLISLLLHWANGYLLYRLILRIGGAWVVALASALLFLLNPHHAETVSWIAATGDLVAGLCILSALILFDRFSRGGNPLYLVSSLALFVVGLLTRETAVMLPALLLLYVAVFRRVPPSAPGMGRATPVRLARLAGALAAFVSILITYVGVLAFGRAAEEVSVSRGGLEFRALNPESILLGISEYAHRLLPGGGRVADLPLDTLRILVWVELAFVLALVVALWRLKQSLALFGLGWMLLTPLLFIFFSAPTDRYFYLPSVGYSIFVAALLVELSRAIQRWRPGWGKVAKWGLALAIAALLVWQARTLLREVGEWREAGLATGSFFEGIRRAEPEPRDYTAFFFLDLPPVIEGVPAFQNSLPQVLHLLYGNTTLAGSAVTCDYLEAQPELPRYSLFFRFTPGGGAQQFSDVGDCR